tara:strand:+ start:77 stop:676 length:600 start_codon:yes stop_codon:yes gene_type:complete
MSDDEWLSKEEVIDLINWFDEEQNSTPPIAPRPAQKKPVQSAQANDDVRKLDFCTDNAPARILSALEDPNYYEKPAELMGLVKFLFSKDNSKHDVWQSFKPYHANLLAYQIASGIVDGLITDIPMVRECYKIMVTIMQNSVSNSAPELKHDNVTTKTVYQQWVLKEMPGEMDNFALIFKFLHKNDKSQRYYGVGKLPME